MLAFAITGWLVLGTYHEKVWSAVNHACVLTVCYFPPNHLASLLSSLPPFPLSMQFENLNTSIESLFSLLNGDDIFETYRSLSPFADTATYLYSRIYLYVFLSLFIYAVLNIFTSLVISAYEASQVCAGYMHSHRQLGDGRSILFCYDGNQSVSCCMSF